MLHLCLYPFVVIARRRPQLHPPLPDNTRPLSGLTWHNLTDEPQLVAPHTPAAHTNPNEARQFHVEFNKSRARGRCVENLVRNHAQRHPLMCVSVRCCITKRQAPCLNTHWIWAIQENTIPVDLLRHNYCGHSSEIGPIGPTGPTGLIGFISPVGPVGPMGPISPIWRNKMLAVVAILLLLWLYGLTIGLFGNMIHLLLIVALVALVFYAPANR